MIAQQPIPAGGFLGALERAAEVLTGKPDCDLFANVVADVAKGRARGLDEEMRGRGWHGRALDVERRARQDAALCEFWRRRQYPKLRAHDAAKAISQEIEHFRGARWPIDLSQASQRMMY